jgi:hypothetical protein
LAKEPKDELEEEEPLDDSAEEASDDSAEEASDDSAEDSAGEPSDDSIEDSAGEPSDDSTEDSAEASDNSSGDRSKELALRSFSEPPPSQEGLKDRVIQTAREIGLQMRTVFGALGSWTGKQADSVKDKKRLSDLQLKLGQIVLEKQLVEESELAEVREAAEAIDDHETDLARVEAELQRTENAKQKINVTKNLAAAKLAVTKAKMHLNSALRRLGASYQDTESSDESIAPLLSELTSINNRAKLAHKESGNLMAVISANKQGTLALASAVLLVVVLFYNALGSSSGSGSTGDACDYMFQTYAEMSPAHKELVDEKRGEHMERCQKKVKKSLAVLDKNICTDGEEYYYEALHSSKTKTRMLDLLKDVKSIDRSLIFFMISGKAKRVARLKFAEDYPDDYADCQASQKKDEAKTNKKPLQNGQIPGYSECLKALMKECPRCPVKQCCDEVNGDRFRPGTFPMCEKDQ